MPATRARHLEDPETQRDLFGVVRGPCKLCSCGQYLKLTRDYTVSPRPPNLVNTAPYLQPLHPDNDVSIMNCNRCGCPPDAHAISIANNERELGNDAYAAGQHWTAIQHYTRGLADSPHDALLYSNRAAAYLATRWFLQALHDAEHALSLRPDWAKAWGRKAAALAGLQRWADTVKACKECRRLDPTSPACARLLKDAQGRVQGEQHWHSNKAAKEALAAGNYRKAIDLYTQALEVSASAQLLCNRSAAYASSAMYKEALADAQAAVKLDQVHRKAWSCKGLALYYLGRHTESAAAYTHALKLGPPSQADLNGLTCAEQAVANAQSFAEPAAEEKTSRHKDQEHPGVLPVSELGVGKGECKQSMKQQWPAQMDLKAHTLPPMNIGDSSSSSQQNSALEENYGAPASNAVHYGSVGMADSSCADASRSSVPSDLGHDHGEVQCTPEEQTVHHQGSTTSSGPATAAGAAVSSSDCIATLKGLTLLSREPSGQSPWPGRPAMSPTSACQASTQTDAWLPESIQEPTQTIGDDLQPAGAHCIHLKCLKEWRSQELPRTQDACQCKGDWSLELMPAASATFTDIRSQHHSCPSPPKQTDNLAGHIWQLEQQKVKMQEALAILSAKIAGARVMMEQDTSPKASPCSVLEEVQVEQHGSGPLKQWRPHQNAKILHRSLDTSDLLNPGLQDSLEASEILKSPAEGQPHGLSLSQNACLAGGLPFACADDARVDCFATQQADSCTSSGSGKDGIVDASDFEASSWAVHQGTEPAPTSDGGDTNSTGTASIHTGSTESIEGMSLETPGFGTFSDGLPQSAAQALTLPSRGSAAEMPGIQPWDASASPNCAPSLTAAGSSQGTDSLTLQAPESDRLYENRDAGNETEACLTKAESDGEPDIESDAPELHQSSSITEELDAAESCSESSEDEWLLQMDLMDQERAEVLAAKAQMHPPGPAMAARKCLRPGSTHSGLGVAALSGLIQGCRPPEQTHDVLGVLRGRCRECGPHRCPVYKPAAGLSESLLLRRCAACGCDSTSHESPEDTADRVASELRQKQAAAEKAQRLLDAVHAKVRARQQRVKAAEERLAKAEEEGDFIQTTNCDGLSQNKRGSCTACTCNQFTITYRTCDANDPNVMLFCAACGCEAAAHSIDEAWQQAQDLQKQREAEATAQRAERARQTAATAASRKTVEEQALAELGLKRLASPTSIRAAYKRLALLHHPDKHQGPHAEAARDRFVLITAAYQTLKSQ
ncbi:hypothetical protein WJX74_001924 [Apatococcus lobatus]|uniref:J domain-containing protein n=1 Tax=Apatococcus lobatus TaxID=904363 RepID=A0AAW1RT65_9CHLO